MLCLSPIWDSFYIFFLQQNKAKKREIPMYKRIWFTFFPFSKGKAMDIIWFESIYGEPYGSRISCYYM